MDERLYIRLRGRVQGPFDKNKLRELVRRGQLSSIHQVSVDKIQWQSASEFSELFPASEEVKSSKNANAGKKEADYEIEGSSSSKKEWHYAIDGVQQTPVALAILKRLIESGKVSSDSLVWTEGMSDWAPVSDLVQFANSIPKSREGNVGRSQYQFANIERTLKDSRSWILGIAICLYAAGALLLISGVVSIVMGIKYNESVPMITGFNSSLVAGVFLWTAQMLTGVNSRIGRFIENKQMDRLDAVLVRIKSLWIFVCIVMILLFVNFIIYLVYLISIGMPLVGQMS